MPRTPLFTTIERRLTGRRVRAAIPANGRRRQTRLRSNGVRVSRASVAGVLLCLSAMAVADVKFAALMPLTGPLAEHGGTAVQGVELAIEEINAAGGVLDGRALSVQVIDTGTDPAFAVDAAKAAFAESEFVGIIGAMSSSVTIEVANAITREARLPQISNASTSPAISNLDDGDFVFRSTPHDAIQGVVLANSVSEQGMTDVSIIYLENDYGRGLRERFTNAFESLGGRVSAAVGYAAGRPSYEQNLSRARTDGTEALLIIAYPDDGIRIVKQSVELGIFDRFIFTDSMRTSELIGAVPARYLEGTIGTAPEPIASASRDHFLSAYRRAFGDSANPFIDTAYDATYLLAMGNRTRGHDNRRSGA